MSHIYTAIGCVELGKSSELVEGGIEIRVLVFNTMVGKGGGQRVVHEKFLPVSFFANGSLAMYPNRGIYRGVFKVFPQFPSLADGYRFLSHRENVPSL